jgi:hypothetical protein
MSGISKLRILCLVAVIALGTIGAAQAEAKKARIAVGSGITLESLSPNGASGFVSSARQACLGQRTVILYREESWTSIPTSGPWATTRTRADGSWVVPGPLPQGSFYAVVGPQQVEKKHVRLTCEDATTSGEKWI